MAGNAFDAVLASIQETDREVFSGIAERNPVLRESVLNRSDYSRNMDELREKVQASEAYETWYGQNWVPNAFGEGKGATKRELQAVQEAQTAKQRADALQAQVAAGGDVNFDEVLTGVNAEIAKRGFLTNADLEPTVAGYTHLAVNGPAVTLKHFQDYGEVINLDDVLKFANENKVNDLTKAYEGFVAPRRAQVTEARHKAELDAAKQEGRKEALQTAGMQSGALPTDMGSPEMGHFQRRMQRTASDTSGAVVPDEVPLGKGVGAYAARHADAAAVEKGQG